MTPFPIVTCHEATVWYFVVFFHSDRKSFVVFFARRSREGGQGAHDTRRMPSWPLMLLMRAPGPGLGPLVLMMRALWGVVHGYPKITRNWVGLAALPAALVAKAKLASYSSASGETPQRARVRCRDRALPDSWGCAHGRAVQVEAWSKATQPPPPCAEPR